MDDNPTPAPVVLFEADVPEDLREESMRATRVRMLPNRQPSVDPVPYVMVQRSGFGDHWFHGGARECAAILLRALAAREKELAELRKRLDAYARSQSCQDNGIIED